MFCKMLANHNFGVQHGVFASWGRIVAIQMVEPWRDFNWNGGGNDKGPVFAVVTLSINRQFPNGGKILNAPSYPYSKGVNNFICIDVGRSPLRFRHPEIPFLLLRRRHQAIVRIQSVLWLPGVLGLLSY